MPVSLANIKVLWAQSGNACAVCGKELTQCAGNDQIPIGEIAHIAGAKPRSARYDSTMSPSERDHHTNLILLCPTCHTIIDKSPNKFTVERLLAYKGRHENDINQAVQSNMLNVTFYELEATLRHLIQSPVTADEEALQLIPLKDKISRNRLSDKTTILLRAGLMQSGQVEEYLNKNVDMDYSNKLRSAFVRSYQEAKEEGSSGDDIFFALMSVASNRNPDPKHMAAGLSVLAYYFQLCEVFEK